VIVYEVVYSFLVHRLVAVFVVFCFVVLMYNNKFLRTRFISKSEIILLQTYLLSYQWFF